MNISSQSTVSRSLLNNSDKMVWRKKKKFLNYYLLLTSELPMGQTVISVSPCSAFCSLKVSYFESSLSAGIEVLQLWFKKKSSELEYSVEYSGLHSSVKFPDVQSNALIHQAQRFWKFLSYYYTAEGQWLQLYFWHL